jgi:hypothetical protein
MGPSYDYGSLLIPLPLTTGDTTGQRESRRWPRFTVHGYHTAFSYSALFLGLSAVVAAVLLRSGPMAAPTQAGSDVDPEPVTPHPLVVNAKATTIGSPSEQPIAS